MLHCIYIFYKQLSSNLSSHSPSAPQETQQMDVEEEELAGSNDDHDGTDESFGHD